MPIDPSVLQSYLDPKMFIVLVVLWILGNLLKKSPIVPDKWIVWLLTLVSIVLAILMFGPNVESIIQGVITVGISVYGHQIVKQSTK